jgi:hypothetical protein
MMLSLFSLMLIMISDSGKPEAVRAAMWSFPASLCFFVGGIWGSISGSWRIAYLPGAACIVVLMLMLSF